MNAIRKPASVSKIIGSYLNRVRANDAVNRYRDLPRWEEVVGPSLAQVTHPEKIVNNILYVRVPDAVWTQELSFKKSEILRRLFEAKVGPALDDIVFLSGNPTDFK